MPIPAQRAGYLPSCSLPFGSFLQSIHTARFPAMGANTAKTGVGFWHRAPCIRGNKYLWDQKQFASEFCDGFRSIGGFIFSDSMCGLYYDCYQQKSAINVNIKQTLNNSLYACFAIFQNLKKSFPIMI